MSGRHFIFILSCFGGGVIFAQAQGEDFRKEFGKDYERATAFLKQETWLDSIAVSHHLKPAEVKAIIFPELIRYNSIQDKIETFALESLYAQYGKAYANFSIGYFQIKPSFAESIEKSFLKIFGSPELSAQLSITPKDTLDGESNRKDRVKRLKNKIQIARYVCAFVKIMESQYPRWKTEEEKIRFFATAYNCGFEKSESEIKSFQSKRHFQTGFGLHPKYNYAAISWYYFTESRK